MLHPDAAESENAVRLRLEAEATAASVRLASLEREEAVRLFDTSAEGKERRSLADKLKFSTRTMTEQETAELDRLDAQRSTLTIACKEAKRKKPKIDEDITVATKAVKDWDKSNNSRRRYLMRKKSERSQLTMTEEELALLNELNTRRASLSGHDFIHK